MPIDAYMVFNPTKSTKQTGSAKEIRGESSDVESQKVGSFEIISFEWGASAGKETTSKKASKTSETTGPEPTLIPSNIATGSVNEKHRVITVENFKISKPFDTASCGLFMACTDPKCVFDEAVIVFRKSGGGKPFVYLKFVFKEVRIDSVDWKLESVEGGDKPDQEDVKCSFQECDIFYSPQTAEGKKETTWGDGTGASSKITATYKREKPSTGSKAPNKPLPPIPTKK